MAPIIKKNNTKELSSMTYLVKILVFTLPLFFLPWTVEAFDFNKQLLLWLFTTLAVFLFLINATLNGKITFKRTPLDIPIVILLVAVWLSIIFSIDWFSSLFGYYGVYDNTYLGLVSLAILYFSITNFFNKRNIKNLIKLLLVTCFIILSIGWLSFFGFLKFFTDSSMVNLTGGALSNFAVFTAVISIFTISLLISGAYQKKWVFLLLAITQITSWLILAIINIREVWGLVLGGSLFVVLIQIIKYKKDGLAILFRNKKYIWMMIPIILAIVFLINQDISLDPYLNKPAIFTQIKLDYQSTFLIAKETLLDKPTFGSGPGTFSYVFSFYRDPEFNYSPLWQLRFDKGGSYLLELLATTGLLGVFSYFLVLGLFFYLFIVRLNNFLLLEKSTSGLITGLFTACLMLLFGQLLFSVNTTLLFLFWLFMAMLMVLWRETNDSTSQGNQGLIFKEVEITSVKNRNVFRLLILTIFLFGAGWVVMFGFASRYLVADIIYKSASGRKEASLIKAAILNPYRYQYQVILSKYYLNKVLEEARKPLFKRSNQAIKLNINNSLKWAREATQKAPFSPLAWETLGMVYRDIVPLTQGSGLWAVKTFKEAIKLEPSNPVLATELAKIYLKGDELEKALVEFNWAIALKDDYYEAELGKARVLAKKSNFREAINILTRLSGVFQDSEVYYELGRLYYNQGNIEMAINRFNDVLSISPDHSNANYSLGLALEAKGEYETALTYFRKVLELNPGSEEIEDKIRELEKLIGD